MDRSGNGTKALAVAVAEDDAAMAAWLKRLLAEMGHRTLFIAGSGQELVEKARAQPPDVVIADVKLPGMDGIEASGQVFSERPVPVILASAYHEDELLDRAGFGPALAYLVKPVEPPQLRAALALALERFQQIQSLSREAAEARQALEDRKLIERAKGIVTKRLRVEEPEAYRRLQKHASTCNHKLADVARELLAADEIFQALEQNGEGASNGRRGTSARTCQNR